MSTNSKPSSYNIVSKKNKQETKKQIEFPVNRLIIRPWPDKILDKLGYDPCSEYVEKYWLPIIGPTTLLLLRNVSKKLKTYNQVQISLYELGPSLGLTHKGGKNSPLWKSILRANRFKLAQLCKDTLYVRLHFPPLNNYQIEKLPEVLQSQIKAK